MASGTQTAPTSKIKFWASYILSAIPALLLIASGVAKLLKPAPVVQSFAHFGYPESIIITIGILEIACTIVYLIPRTAMLGAILVTGYLGGATATNVRVGDPSSYLTVILGVLVWAGLYLRDDRLTPLIPLRSPKST
jgi:DoxX-like family